MPKGMVNTISVNKDVFLYVLKQKGYSIRKLGEEPSIMCSEKTIRRELNEKKGLRPQYIDQIARFINVDSKLLTGELVKKAFYEKDKTWRHIYLQPLNHIENFPYFREEQDALKKEKMEETLKRVLSLFEVSYSQFQNKDFEEQYDFQHDLLNAILPVMYKHFDRDGYGDESRQSFEKIIYDLESYKEDYYERQYADTVVRKKFLSKPPKGYSVKDIKKMSTDDLIALDMSIQTES